VLLVVCLLCTGGGCARAPYVNSIYVGPEPVSPRASGEAVEVLLSTQAVSREYVLLGSVEVSSTRANRSAEDMLKHAKRRALRMGADALIKVEFGSLGASQSEASRPSGVSIDIGGSTRILRVLKAEAVRWK